MMHQLCRIKFHLPLGQIAASLYCSLFLIPDQFASLLAFPGLLPRTSGDWAMSTGVAMLVAVADSIKAAYKDSNLLYGMLTVISDCITISCCRNRLS